MEIDSTNHENSGASTKCWNKLKDSLRILKKKVEKIAMNTKNIGRDDPRKIWHAFKVGLALTLVSLFYYTKPLFQNFDQQAMWAVLTVVVAFEFTAGATISKSLNRGFGTTTAGALGLGAKYLAELIGKQGPDPIVLGVLVFIVGTIGTFTRFYPYIKRRYDYGTMIFVLTFSLVVVSSYRTEDIFQLAQRRIHTILVGVSTVMVISLLIRPVWAGEDLHNLATINLEKLANFLQGFGSEYFHIYETESVEGIKNNEKGFHEAILSVLGSKANEETLANLAWWEPPHGSFKLTHPWKQYLKICGLVRKCASLLLALSGHLNSKSQAPTEFEKRTEQACKIMIMESNKALKELALSIKTMTHPFSTIIHINNAKNAIDDLKDTLGTSKTFFRHDESCVMDVVHAASVVSLLVDITKCVEEIYEAVEELSRIAHFEKERRERRRRRRRGSCLTEAVAAGEENPPPPPSSQSHRAQIMHHGIVSPTEDEHVVQIEIDDNIEATKRVVVEETNKGGPFFIWTRGGTSKEIVKEKNMPKKKEQLMELADIKFYNSTQFFESAKGVAILEEANQVNNPLATRKGGCIVIGIRENTLKMKGDLADHTKLYNSTQFLESVLVTMTTIMEEMKMVDAKPSDHNTQLFKSIVIEVNQE